MSIPGMVFTKTRRPFQRSQSHKSVPCSAMQCHAEKLQHEPIPLHWLDTETLTFFLTILRMHCFSLAWKHFSVWGPVPSQEQGWTWIPLNRRTHERNRSACCRQSPKPCNKMFQSSHENTKCYCVCVSVFQRLICKKKCSFVCKYGAHAWAETTFKHVASCGTMHHRVCTHTHICQTVHYPTILWKNLHDTGSSGNIPISSFACPRKSCCAHSRGKTGWAHTEQHTSAKKIYSRKWKL